jgi:hypothetical protein
VGSLDLDLRLLAERSTLFLPFHDHDKVLELRLYEPSKETSRSNGEHLKQQREEFLQQRFDFLDKIAEHEVELKKKFSERVYHFLKELKNRNVAEGLADRETIRPHPDSSRSNNRNEVDFRIRLTEERPQARSSPSKPKA